MQVNITKRIDTPEGKRYCPVVVGPNGRIKPDSVMVDGKLRMDEWSDKQTNATSYASLSLGRELAIHPI